MKLVKMSRSQKNITVKLIECYKEKPVLWDLNAPKYGDKHAMMLAIKEIAEEMKMTSELCIKKLLNIHRVYKKEKIMVSNAKMKGKVYEPKWYVFKILEFLGENNLRSMNNWRDLFELEEKSEEFSSVIQNDSSSSMSSMSELEPMDIRRSLLAGKVVVKVETISTSDSESEVEGPQLKRLRREDKTVENGIKVSNNEDPKRDKSRSNLESEPVIANASDLSNSFQVANQGRICSGEDKECHSYGNFIGNKLRNYSKSMRSKVQHAFSNILFSADQGHLDVRS